MKFFTQYNNRTPKSTVKFTQPSRTKQNHKYESDIHNQLLKFATREQLQLHEMASKPIYGDFSQMPDFNEAQNLVARTKEYFDGLPSHMRAQFNNDSAQFVSFVGNPANADQAVKMGILEKMAAPVKQQLENLQNVMPEQAIEEPTTQQGESL